MGQLESVQVHRLVSDEGVDQRVRDLLARKKELFESFARESDTAASAPEAYDITEAELARDIIAAERERLFGYGVPAAPAQQPAATPAHVPGASSPTWDSTAPESAATAPITPATPNAAGEMLEPLLDEATVQPVDDPAADRPCGVPARGKASTAPRTPAAESTVLMPYPVFRQALPSISKTPPDTIVDNVVSIVSVEGPMTGWRIHQVYTECASGRDLNGEVPRLLNRAISAAERSGLIVSENPLGRSGNKPLTFRLPTQSTAIARELGPRTIDVVPPNEVVQYGRIAAAGKMSVSEEALIGRVGRLFQNPPQSADLRRAVRVAKRIHSP